MASPLLVISTVLGLNPSPEQTATQQRRVLKPEDFNAIRDVDEPNISRDGDFVAYAVKAADTEKDNLPGNLWLAKWDGTENRALTFGNKGLSHPRWSRDGKRIAFVSGRENENEVDQLWILSSSGEKRKNSPT